MTALQPAVIGDIGDTRIIQLDGVDTLDDVTAIEAHVWIEHRKSSTAVTLAAEVLDAGDRTIVVDLGTDPETGWLPAVARRNEWLIEYQLTFGSTVLTWPNGDPDTINVREQGD